MNVCQHTNYDDYFERCEDCVMTGEQIHNNECVVTGFEIEDGMCNQCGTILEEVE